MIRAFVSTWVFIPERMEVTNPIAELGVPCRMYYADADADGFPDGPNVLVFVDAPVVDGQAIAAATGAYMFPPYPFTTPLDDIPQPVKDEVVGMCAANNWMPIEPLFTVAETYGDCLRLLANHISPAVTSFGSLESERSEEFG